MSVDDAGPDTLDGLDHYLKANIPLTQAMAVRVERVAPEEVVLVAPLAPNLNHRGTAFGGSVASLAVLAGWSWLAGRLASRAPPPRLVIQQQTIRYLEPIEAEFRARCGAPADDTWRRFLRALDTRGRGRIELEAEVRCAGRLAAQFTGQYVAVGSTPTRD
ncbi:MAG: thioesterase domain-containing protein [Proteobacteria bacterium]|nr:thioesterase domain-containing protein [Pseudomonadota bacterium]